MNLKLKILSYIMQNSCILLFGICNLNLSNCIAQNNILITDFTNMKSTEIDQNTLEEILMILNKEENFNPPFKKSPFIITHKISDKKITIELSTSNSKFKIIEKNKETKIGHYDYYLLKVNEWIYRYVKKDQVEIQKIKLIRIGSRKVSRTVNTIGNYPIIDTSDFTINVNDEDSKTLEELVFNFRKTNRLYNFDNTSGTSSIFTPSVAIIHDDVTALIGLGIPTTTFYRDHKAFKRIKMNPNANEFLRLKRLIKKYYPNINY